MGVSIEEVKRAFEAVDPDTPVTQASSVPGSYNAITREWLEDVICRNVPGAQLQSFSLGEKDDGSSNRRRIFLQYNSIGEAAGLPSTVFCKAAETLGSRIILAIAETALGEVNFYNLVRPRLDIEAPKSRYAGYDPKTFAYFVMLDDMAGKVHFVDERDEVTWDQAQGLVRTLARLHSAFYESAELGNAALPFSSWPDCWNNIINGAPDFARFCDEGFVAARTVMPERLFGRRTEIWPATLRSVERHNQLPKCLLHSDVHWKNWYRTEAGELGLTDWQLTTIGHWSRDFVFATVTALTVEQRRQWHADLLKLYIEEMRIRGVRGLEFDDALLNVRQQLFTALAFWTITLRPTDDMPDMQPERSTYEFLRRMLTAIDDYDALDAFEEA